MEHIENKSQCTELEKIEIEIKKLERDALIRKIANESVESVWDKVSSSILGSSWHWLWVLALALPGVFFILMGLEKLILGAIIVGAALLSPLIFKVFGKQKANQIQRNN